MKGKCIEIRAYLIKNETFQINNLTPHLHELEEQQQRQPRESKRKEIIKTRVELNDTETKITFLKLVNPGTGSWKK